MMVLLFGGNEVVALQSRSVILDQVYLVLWWSFALKLSTPGTIIYGRVYLIVFTITTKIITLFDSKAFPLSTLDHV